MISIFLLGLQWLAKSQDWEWLAEPFQQMKGHVQNTTSEIAQNKGHMMKILEGKESHF